MGIIECLPKEEENTIKINILKIHRNCGKVFKETKPNRWRYFYSSNRYYLDTLRDFIVNEKPLIDQYLSSHPESGIPLADKDVDDEYVKVLPGYKGYIESIQKSKKIGSVKIKASDYIMTFQHNELSDAMVKYLSQNGYLNVKAEDEAVRKIGLPMTDEIDSG